MLLVGCSGSSAVVSRQDCKNEITPIGSKSERMVTVVVETSLGDISIEVFPEQAPITVANFLAYIDGEHYADASFYRVVGTGREPGTERAPVLGIQGGLLGTWFRKRGEGKDAERETPKLPPIAHETTKVTGIKNKYGVVGMARREPGTATSEFYINLADNIALDYGENGRNPDGQGYAAFGRVSCGMEIVEAIHDLPTDDSGNYQVMAGELINDPVRFIRLYRVPQTDN